MPFREKRPDEQVFSQLVPLSRPVCRADWRKSARLFAYRPGVHCRDGLAAGGKWIRTISTWKISDASFSAFGCVAYLMSL